MAKNKPTFDVDFEKHVLGVPVPIIGVTGEKYTGKTLFLSSLAPKDTHMIDMEKSSETYNIPFGGRTDMYDELGKQDWTPLEAFEWFQEFIIKKVEPGKQRVIAVDPISDIEVGLPEYVANNFSKYGYSSATAFKSMKGVFWGHVNAFWKSFLGKIAQRCEIFAFSTHMRDQFAGDKRTGKREPKGKNALAELASLYLLLQKNLDEKGKVNPIPKGVVLKSRLAHSTFNDATGEIEFTPILPPVLPLCSVSKIREYVKAPPDFKRLKQGEYEKPKEITEADMEQMRLERAQAEQARAEADLDRVERQQNAAASIRQHREDKARSAQADEVASSTISEAERLAKAADLPEPPPPVQEEEKPSTPEQEDPPNPFASATGGNDKLDGEQVACLEFTFDEAGITEEQKADILGKTNCTSVMELEYARAREIYLKLRDIIMKKQLVSGK